MLIVYGQRSYCVNVRHFVPSPASPVSRMRMSMIMMYSLLLYDHMVCMYICPSYFVIASKSSEEADDDEHEDGPILKVYLILCIIQQIQ